MSGPAQRIAPTGFREYDLRWRYPDQIDRAGLTVVGRGIGTQMHARGLPPRIVLGRDFRSYSPEVAAALAEGLIEAGIEVHDIGMALSPMAYFARGHLGIAAVAMVTASHNPNGWTGVKIGFEPPLTHGAEDMAELRRIVLDQGGGPARPGGSLCAVQGIAKAYLDDLAGDFRLSRRLRIVCATGNGTASAFAPALLERIGAVVIPLHCTLDATFPHYNPNPEALEMLADMARAVRETAADLALGFDGDGDRCGAVDDEGHEIPADKIGLLMARDLAARHPGALFLADVKSTGLFAADPVLAQHGARAEYWMTGHSHMKRRLRDRSALLGVEKSAHFYFGPPVGRGYDCGLRAAVEICRMIDRAPGQSLSDFRRALPVTYTSPTMGPFCPDTEKYRVVARLTEHLRAMQAQGVPLAGRAITDIVTVNGARVMLDHGGWILIRASSNTPNLVVVCESPESEDDLYALFRAADALTRTEPSVGAYDQDWPPAQTA